MGEVYKARDTRLDRIVALKISKREFTERFEREARAISALNHPHICQLYDVGPNFLVMEFAEGAPIKGPLPVEKALEYSRQILDALDHAHKHKITHRDLKPANIMITRQGVKLLDFGLAKVETGPLRETDETVTQALTKQGQIVGTLQYMSPEQLQGKEADARSDIFSFGAVLYEMLSGKRAFEGSSAASVIAAVLERQPAPLELSPPLDRVIRACLEKDPDQRMQVAHDVKRALEWAAEPQVQARATSKRPWMIATLGLLLVAAALGWIAWRATRPITRPLIRLDVDLGSNISLPASDPLAVTIALSPDGTRLVYTASVAGGQPRLFTRRLDEPKATELPGTEAAGVFFSPDGQWIGFGSLTRGLNKISVEGGAVVPIAVERGIVNNPAGLSWSEDGNLIISDAGGRGLLEVPAGGGSTTVLAGLDKNEIAARPQSLPGGKAILFTLFSPGSPAGAVQVLTLPDRRRKTVVPAGTSARYLPVSGRYGYLVYTRKGNMFAMLFDMEKLETRGSEVPVLDGIGYAEGPFEGAHFAYSDSGTLVYRRGAEAPEMKMLQWVDPAGSKQPLQMKPDFYYLSPMFSPVDKRLAVGVRDASGEDIWVYNPEGDSIRLSFGGAAYGFPAWSPNGRYIIFSSAGKGLFWVRGDGAGQPQLLIPSQANIVPFSFTPDGKRLAYYDSQIWTVPVEEDSSGLKAGKPEQFFKDGSMNLTPAFSPDDGHWLAYESNATGSFEVYVRPFPSPASGQSAPAPLSNRGSPSPFRLAWSRTSHELYYQSGDQIMALSYEVKGDTFVRGKTRVWIQKVGGNFWDIAPDGKRVAVVTPVESAESTAQQHTVVFLLNFLDYLKQRVPLN
jgi:serine/threonine-protein kinase